MPPIRCMFWNVRNLSQELNRPGRRSREFTIQQKIRHVTDTITSGGYDLTVLLETGADAQEIFTEFRNGLPIGFNVWGSPLTPNAPGGETYLVVYRAGLQLNFPFAAPVAGPNLNFFGNQGPRQPLGFEVLMPAEPAFRPYLICWHAPSSSGMNRANRRATLVAAVNDVNARVNPNSDVLFFGDLNFESTEQADLNGALTAPWNHLGPVDGAGNRELTSLRLFQNIIRTNQYGSQPYDQAWERMQIGPVPTGYSFQDCELLGPGIVPPVVHGYLVNYIRQNLMNSSRTAAQSFRSIPTRDRSNVLMRNFSGGAILAEVINCIQLSRDILSESDALSLQDEPKKWKVAIQRLRTAQSKLKELRIVDHANDAPHPFSPFELRLTLDFNRRRATRSKCVRILDGLKKLNRSMLLLSNYLNNLTGAHQTTDLAAYEYAISDHLPVAFTYG